MKAKYCLLAVTAAFICVLIGIFIGRNTAGESYILSPSDNQQTVIPSGTEHTQSGKIDLNHATVSQLSMLPGIGETLAQRIIQYREEHGDFLSVDDLTLVNGIGDKKLEGVAEYLTIGG